MKFYIDGKKVSRKSLLEAVGQDRMGRIEKESRQAHQEEPLEQLSFAITYQGRTKIVEVCFDV